MSLKVSFASARRCSSEGRAGRRAVRGVPVWSSYAAVGLTAKGEVGSVEIHWPEVSEAVFKEASVLQQVVNVASRLQRSWELARVDPERSDSFARDRLLHGHRTGSSRRVCRRAARRRAETSIYLDRHGDAVELPRTIRLTETKPG